MNEIKKIDLNSLNVKETKIEELKKILPEIFSEGKIDLDAFQREIGEWVDEDKERYGLVWSGKANCMKVIQQPSTGTLLPMRDESVNFDKADNLIIEGDNLEVLKLLQKSYYGKVKLIYIDPPYNTGKEFIYPDNYQEGLQDYLKRTDQVDGNGFKISTNTDTGGRYHTNWLNMMYPRLYLARNLLKDDGVIFISIDDHELSNLLKICDEIFGEDNFRNIFTLKRYDKNVNRQFMDDGLATFNTGFEYILCYSKSSSFKFQPIFREASEDRQENGYWKGFWNDADRPTMRYEVLGFSPVEGQWKWSKDKATEAIENYKVYENDFSKKMTLEEYWASTGKEKKFLRRNLNGKGKNMGVEHWIPPSEGVLRNTNWLDMFASKATDEVSGLFDFPKNPEAIKVMLTTIEDSDFITLDFFAGSGSTAQAVIDLNQEDGGKRKFILVQLPEKTELEDYPTISAVTRERVKRVIKSVESNLFNKESNSNLGFKAFKLNSSNFSTWDPSTSNVNKLSESLKLFAENTNTERTAEDMLYEILLKASFELSSLVEILSISGKEVFSVAEGALLICLDRDLTLEVIEGMLDLHPFQIICLDEGFKGNDQLKVNAVQTIKSRQETEDTKTVFRVV